MFNVPFYYIYYIVKFYNTSNILINFIKFNIRIIFINFLIKRKSRCIINLIKFIGIKKKRNQEIRIRWKRTSKQQQPYIGNRTFKRRLYEATLLSLSLSSRSNSPGRGNLFLQLSEMVKRFCQTILHGVATVFCNSTRCQRLFAACNERTDERTNEWTNERALFDSTTD